MAWLKLLDDGANGGGDETVRARFIGCTQADGLRRVQSDRLGWLEGVATDFGTSEIA